jgi:hypothetical protein
MTWEAVCNQLGMNIQYPAMSISHYRELARWMLDWIGGLDEKELAIGVMVLYQLWLARNDAREETRILDPL